MNEDNPIDQHHESDNFGGFHTILVAKAALLPADLMSSFDQMMSSMFEFGQKVHIETGTGIWEETQNTNRQGDFWEQRIKFKIPKMRSVIANFSLSHAFCKVLCLVKTYNNQWVLIGRPRSPLEMQYKATTGEGAKSKNEIEFTIIGSSFKPAQILPYEYSDLTPDDQIGDFDPQDFNLQDFY